MAVITKYVIVRDGAELDLVFSDKKEAEAHDRMLDASEALCELILKEGKQFTIDAETVNSICIHLAKNASTVSKILKNVKPFKAKEPSKAKTTQNEPVDDKKKGVGSRAKSKAN